MKICMQQNQEFLELLKPTGLDDIVITCEKKTLTREKMSNKKFRGTPYFGVSKNGVNSW